MSNLANGSGEGGNQKVKIEECARIRALSDFDMVMLISDINDHGWSRARTTLSLMSQLEQAEARRLQAPPN